MAPPNIPASSSLSSSSKAPPPVPVKQRSQNQASPSTPRTQSAAVVASTSSSHLARKLSASPSSHLAGSQQPLHNGRKPSRPVACPSSSRPLLSNPALDASQDHHRSDSGRSSGSSRSTATTDSFFLPQHPHALSRRFKELPMPPTSPASADTVRQGKQADALAPQHGLNVVVDSSAASSAAPLPASSLIRSKSSVSTTPTSPEEADGSPYELLEPDADQAPEAESKSSGHDDGLDDFWKADYSYARSPTKGNDSSLPPLMRANAPIPPSRSQSLDPLAVPLDQLSDGHYAPHLATSAEEDDDDRSVPAPPGGQLVEANLRKLEGEVSLTEQAEPTAPTPSNKVATRPHLVPYQHPTASTSSSSSSAVGHRSQANKSTSSLSTSSAHDGDKTALATASKRSSTSSSSSFRMTLSRQAKSLRNSFLWSPPPGEQAQLAGSERASLSQSARTPDASSVVNSNGVYVGSIDAPSNSTATGLRSSQPDSRPGRRPTTAMKGVDVDRGLAANRGSAFSSTTGRNPVAPTLSKQSSIPRPQGSPMGTTPARSTNASPEARRHQPTAKAPTDYSKIEERPKSRLASRLLLQGSALTLKLPHLKQKKPAVSIKGKFMADSEHSRIDQDDAVQSGQGARRATMTKETFVVANGHTFSNQHRIGRSSEATLVAAVPGPVDLPPSPLLTSGHVSGDAQLSPSFAETFAFLNSHIDTVDKPFIPATTIAKLPTNSAAAEISSRSNAATGPALEVTTIKDPQLVADSKVVDLKSATVVLNSRQQVKLPGDAAEDKALKDAMFDRLADSPEAVYKTLVFPEVQSMPSSQSLDNIAHKGKQSGKKVGHKKQMSLGSATLISKSASKAASDLDKRASGAPVVPSGLPLTHGQVSTSSTATVLPMFTPVDEESRFFDALTSPQSEQPPTADSNPSLAASVLPSFATASEFFPKMKADASDASPERQPASLSAVNVAATNLSASQSSRRSLGRRFSGVFDPPRTRQMQNDTAASPPQSPRDADTFSHAVPARPETSLGFHLRNPLRRDRKISLKKATQDTKSKAVMGPVDAVEKVKATASPRSMSPAAAIRKMSSGFRTERTMPSKTASERPGTSLGFSTANLVKGKTPRAFSSSVLAPTKSSLARSVQPSSPSNSRITARSVSASTLTTPESNSPSRSPQRPANPPSSFRAGGSTSSRTPAFSTGSPIKPSKLKATSTGSNVVSTEPAMTSAPDLLDLATSESKQDGRSSSPEPMSPESSGVDPSKSSAIRMDIRRRRTLSRPVLSPIRTSITEERPFARPSTALGFRAGMSGQDRKMSQPTLDMVDDREFLEALEQVRQIHRERIQAHAQDLENKTRLARLGMMSGNYLRTKVSGSMLDDDEKEQDQAHASVASKDESSNGQNSSLDRGRSGKSGASAAAQSSSRLRHKRSASAGAKLGRERSASSASLDSDKDIDQRQKDIVKAYTDKVSPVGAPTTGLEWGVGKASGKLHDGAFVNDDDWKKEVKALFLIRELVQTERSYARHLGSLLSVVRKLQTVAGGSNSALGVKRKSASNLFAAYSQGKTAANGSPPGHVALLRMHLPQLIALSNALVHRVEANPTSAGVGAAFDALAAQLESTFVGWSGVASQALRELRATELTKGKSAFKIGLVPLTPRDSSEVGATTSASSASGSSSPGFGLRHPTLRMTSLTRPPSPVGVRAEQDDGTNGEAGGATMPAKRSTKRRSTITSTSFIPPRLIVASPSVLSTSPNQDGGDSTNGLEHGGAGLAAAGDNARMGAPSTRRFGHSRSQSTLVTPLPTPTSAGAPDVWSGLSMTSSSTIATGTAGSTQLGPAHGGTAKCLTPMDIAIMPTQRIPRYGLMLRDLLRNTPPESLSHVRVQRAMALIQKIATMCDSAAPAPAVSTAGGSGTGTASPSRASSVLGMTSRESLSMGSSPLLPAASFAMTKRM